MQEVLTPNTQNPYSSLIPEKPPQPSGGLSPPGLHVPRSSSCSPKNSKELLELSAEMWATIKTLKEVDGSRSGSSSPLPPSKRVDRYPESTTADGHGRDRVQPRVRPGVRLPNDERLHALERR